MNLLIRMAGDIKRGDILLLTNKLTPLSCFHNLPPGRRASFITDTNFVY